jgi:hypothetical protein
VAWRFQPAQDAAAFSKVVEEALEATGLDRLPRDRRPGLATDRRPALISQDFGQHLETWGQDQFAGALAPPHRLPERPGQKPSVARPWPALKPGPRTRMRLSELQRSRN